MARSKTPGRDHIDGHPQQGFQILGEPHLIKERRLRLKVNEEIDVAGRSGIASGDRPEDPHPRRVTTKSGRQDRLSTAPEGVDRRYDLGHIRSVPGVRTPWSAAARLLGEVGMPAPLTRLLRPPRACSARSRAVTKMVRSSRLGPTRSVARRPRGCPHAKRSLPTLFRAQRRRGVRGSDSTIERLRSSSSRTRTRRRRSLSNHAW